MARHGHDYDTAKLLKLKGLTYNEIAEQTGIPYEALKRYGIRHGWDKQRAQVTETVSRSVTKQIAEAANRHLLKISGLSERGLDALIAKADSDMPLEKLQTLANVADTFDRIARRTYGLDAKGEHGPQVALQVNVNGQERVTSSRVVPVHVTGENVEQG